MQNDNQENPMFYKIDGEDIKSIGHIEDDDKTIAFCHRNGRDSEYLQDGLSVRDFEIQRPFQADPREWNKIFDICDSWYIKNGIVRNIIDLMGDFCVAGIQVSSPVPLQQTVLRKWFKTVKGYHISERIANKLYRLGNVGIRKLHGTIRVRIKEDWKKIKANIKDEIKIKEPRYSSEKIPYKYVTIDPRQIETPNPEVAAFLGEDEYYLKMPNDKNKIVSISKNNGLDNQQYYDKIPTDIRDALETGMSVKLDNDRFSMFHYKKDDNQIMAFPLIYAALSELTLFSAMELADKNIVDSAINNITVVKVGDAKTNLIPSAEYNTKLAKQFQKAGRSGTTSYVFTHPYISLETVENKLAQILGRGKYEMVLEVIRNTFGIPNSLSGSDSGSAANNYTSIKVLIKKLDYVRSILKDFWQEELNAVCAAFGFKAPVYITFANQELGDEAAMKKFMQDAYDRRVISEELYQESISVIPKLENERIKRETKQRKKGKKPAMATPYLNGNVETELQKIGLQTGLYNLEELNVEVTKVTNPVRKAKIVESTDQSIRILKEQTKLQKETQQAPTVPTTPISTKDPNTEPKGTPGQGRPKNAKDTEKRKEKQYSPKTR